VRSGPRSNRSSTGSRPSSRKSLPASSPHHSARQSGSISCSGSGVMRSTMPARCSWSKCSADEGGWVQRQGACLRYVGLR
jgi:hypothetical protein